MVQRRVSKCSCFKMKYEDRIKLLCWPTLEERRTFLSLVECYKIIHRLNGFYPTNYFDFPNINYNLRKNYSLALIIPSSRIDIFKYSFFTRVVKDNYLIYLVQV